MDIKKLHWPLVLVFWLLSQVSFAQTDRSGAADYAGLDRFPLSYIVNYALREIPEYRLVLGGLEKVNGVITPEHEQRLKGHITKITYRIPAGHTSGESLHFLRDQLKQQGADILFECQSRDCGSSNYWANTIFHNAKLYGRDQSQRYLVAKKGERFYVIYTITRGNKRVYAHLEVLETRSSDLTAKLLEQGYVKVGEQPLPESLFDYLKQHPDMQLWLVGFDRTQSSVQTGLDQSAVSARALQQQFLARGVEADRLHLFAVGALAPLMVNKGESGLYIIRE
ncbi:MAG: DUF4892 domain-containing protein [Pontibacterium sp.]